MSTVPRPINIPLRASNCNLAVALLLSAAALQASNSLYKCPLVPASPRPIADAKVTLLTSLFLHVVPQEPQATPLSLQISCLTVEYIHGMTLTPKAAMQQTMYLLFHATPMNGHMFKSKGNCQ